jgi:hypothetical protein
MLLQRHADYCGRSGLVKEGSKDVRSQKPEARSQKSEAGIFASSLD